MKYVVQATADRTPGKIEVMDIRIWTPSGEETGSWRVHERKAYEGGRTLTEYQQWEAARHATQNYNGIVPSPGLWYQARERLRRENPHVEDDFITGPAEDTSMVLKFLKADNNYADGLVIQYPAANADGTDFERDEKGMPRARQIWQMALPVGDSYVKNMPEELNMFLDTLYGMPDARNRLPYRAFVFMSNPQPQEERRVLRRYWNCNHRESRRADVDGRWDPADKDWDVGFRVFEGGEDSIRNVDARIKQ